tara:strand:+ start:470 stop:697 length:228 start_codon:yes stop_codon:yes gene_type:complete
MFVELFELVEGIMVATTLSVGLVSTSVSIVKGTNPPDFSAFITSVQPPYESDDKRIYPEIFEKKHLVPPEERYYE